jgi:hypothetical protein
MEGPSILINEPAGPRRSAPVQDFMLGWRLLFVLGWLFTVVGLLNTVLLWYPFRFGVPEYEFGSVAASLDGLPVTMMGLTLALAGSRARGKDGAALLATVLLWAIAVLVIAGGVLYWLNVPLALQQVTEPVIRTGIKKSMAKVTVQALVYPAAMIALAILGSRSRSKH